MPVGSVSAPSLGASVGPSVGLGLRSRINVGALKVRIGFCDILYYIYNHIIIIIPIRIILIIIIIIIILIIIMTIIPGPQNSLGKYYGPCIATESPGWGSRVSQDSRREFIGSLKVGNPVASIHKSNV